MRDPRQYEHRNRQIGRQYRALRNDPAFMLRRLDALRALAAVHDLSIEAIDRIQKRFAPEVPQ